MQASYNDDANDFSFAFKLLTASEWNIKHRPSIL